MEDLVWGLSSENFDETVQKLTEAIAKSKHLFPYTLYTIAKVFKQRVRVQKIIFKLIDLLGELPASSYYNDLLPDLKKIINPETIQSMRTEISNTVRVIADDILTPEIKESLIEKQNNGVNVLGLAARIGSINSFKFLILNNPDTNLDKIHKDSVRGGNKEIIAMLKHDDDFFKPYLKTAIKSRHYWIVNEILSKYNVHDYENDISVSLCITTSNIRLTYYLIIQNFDANVEYKNENPLLTSCKIVLRPVITSILEICRLPVNWRHLYEANKRKDLHLVKQLVEYGIDLNEVIHNVGLSVSPICLVIEKRIDAIFDRLVDIMDPNVTTFVPTTFLMLFKNPNIEILQYLLKHKVRLKPHTTKALGFEAPLMIAARSGVLHYVEYLVKKGALVNNISPISGETALVAAISVGKIEIAIFLMKHGANPNIPANFTHTSDWPQTAFSILLETGLLDKIPQIRVESLIFTAADLCAACRLKNQDLMTRIVRSGVNINEILYKFKNKSQNGCENIITPFIISLSTNDFKIVTQAIELGGKVNNKILGITPMGFSICNGWIVTVMALVEKGHADLTDNSNIYGITENYLQMAVTLSNFLLLKYLVAIYIDAGKNAYVNDPGLVVRAALNKCKQIIEYLISLKVDVSGYAKNVFYQGMVLAGPISALNVACNNLDEDLIKLLLSAGAIPDQNDYKILSKHFPQLMTKLHPKNKPAQTPITQINLKSVHDEVINSLKQAENQTNPGANNEEDQNQNPSQPAEKLPQTQGYIIPPDFRLTEEDFTNSTQFYVSWSKSSRIPTFEHDSVIV